MLVPLDPADLALLRPVVAEDGRSGRFELVAGLVRHDGALYGGTGLAASVLAMQAATGREVLWATAQLLSSPRLGAEIEWTVDVLAQGKRSSQVLVRATSAGTAAFVAVGSAGVHDADGLTGRYRQMPKVAGPDDSTLRDSLAALPNPDSYVHRIELREADVLEPGPDAAIWVRRRDGVPLTPVSVAFAADFVPLAIARAAHKVGAGASLDNSMRFRGGPATEWVLLDLRGDFAAGGYGHGSVRVWAEDGTYLAIGSQTASMVYLFDER